MKLTNTTRWLGCIEAMNEDARDHFLPHLNINMIIWLDLNSLTWKW